ncbi:hypothetical protein ZWY2020_011158 [Hordeum vulgare]|nr:hypothetical protein ZWY2020_011158 [Hordeum vulgare]
MQELPLVSKLDEQTYGPTDSLITKEFIEEQINGVMTAEEAVAKKKLFMLDYHDLYLPFVNKVRQLEGTTLYGHALFFLAGDALRPSPSVDEAQVREQATRWRGIHAASTCQSGITGLGGGSPRLMSPSTSATIALSPIGEDTACVEPYIIVASSRARCTPSTGSHRPGSPWRSMPGPQLAHQRRRIIESTFLPGSTPWKSARPTPVVAVR